VSNVPSLATRREHLTQSVVGTFAPYSKMRARGQMYQLETFANRGSETFANRGSETLANRGREGVSQQRTDVCYSYLRASMGLRREARVAG